MNNVSLVIYKKFNKIENVFCKLLTIFNGWHKHYSSCLSLEN